MRSWTVANPELTAFLVKGAALALSFGVAARVVGFGLAVARGNLLCLVTLFWRFDAAGKNVSTLARALRGVGAGLRWSKVISTLCVVSDYSPAEMGAVFAKGKVVVCHRGIAVGVVYPSKTVFKGFWSRCNPNRPCD